MSIHKYCHIFNSQIFDSFVCKIVYLFWYTRVHYLDTCSESGNRTRKVITDQRILSPSCLPISPSRLKSPRLIVRGQLYYRRVTERISTSTALLPDVLISSLTLSVVICSIRLCFSPFSDL